MKPFQTVPPDGIGPIRLVLYDSRYATLTRAYSIHHPPSQVRAWGLLTVRRFGIPPEPRIVCIPFASDEGPVERHCDLGNGIRTLEYLCANPTESF